ncbi:hypothetical protein K440DRAFT_172799 [Wilcoxina mikolae CBS 423.85]|nr:hypothetical protein K440DRAFT_172799 [Wilcoxina mikolae CBS 423.85]
MVNEIEEGDDEESDEDNDRELTIPGNTSSIVRWCESLSPGPFSSKSESEWSEKSYWSDDLYEGIKSPTNTDSKVELVASDHGAGDVDTKGTPCQGSDSEDDSDGGSSDSTGCQSGCFDFSSNCSSGFSSSSEGGFSSDSDMDSDPGSPQSPIVPASEPPSVSGSEDNENHSDGKSPPWFIFWRACWVLTLLPEESITTATSIDRTEFSAVVYNIMLDMGKDHIAWTREALANLQALMEEFAVKEMEALAMICKHRNGDTIEPKDSEMLGKLREMWRMYN